ncbi:DUF2336 domain-containing protein [Pseudemcibacter aquimaris]|uniref:DUF2336 domain-containing protein n=1 Tax=Pseudemcibacter aquimaris TaxID=2857064 RepID=UPI002010FE74|nr:DUF2336 domain-containing protein [Pseudemcibacter aquimaris]MCC3860626.1 DUF2336 domain-containing protein [Pseudemcibacter aquimaris]WDU59445.1 DUF2336 domain-containing protein [Pseudemcibacter aquimaris]
MSENLSSQSLLKLAMDSSKGSKDALMENITDLFLSSKGRLNEHERVLMNDIMVKLLKTVEKTIRKNLSKKLAESDEISIELVTMLANDNIEIAQPVLEKSKLLRDEDLIETIRNRTDAHRLSIAIREHVSENVSGELIEHGSEDVIEALIRNENAEISQASLDYLVQESRSVDRFQEPLVNRNDLSFEMAHKMYWWVTAALRRKIVEDFDVDPNLLDDALESATKEIIANHNEEDGVMQKAILLVRTMNNQRRLNFDFVVTSLRQQKINVAVAALAEMSGLGVKIIWRVIREKNDEGLAVISRAIGLEKSQFSSMFLLILQVNSGPKARSTSILNTMLSLYDRIKPANARAAVKYWQRDYHFQEAQLLLQDAC